MSLSARTRRRSWLLLAVLAVGFAAAGIANAASAGEMDCCPAGVERAGGGCTWLGAGDCCPARATTAVTPLAAAPAPPPLLTCLAVDLGAGNRAPIAFATDGVPFPRSAVLRL